MDDDEITQINFMVGTVEEEKEVLVSFRGFESIEEAEAYADWLSDNLMLLLDESNVATMH